MNPIHTWRSCLVPLAMVGLGACNSDLLGLPPEYCPPGRVCHDMAAPGGGGDTPCDPNASSGDYRCPGGGQQDGGGGGPGPTEDMAGGPIERELRFGPLPGASPFDFMSPGSVRVRLNNDEYIVIDTRGLTLSVSSYIWVANSGNGTESKIDAKTLKQVARYCTYPGCNGDPSRTTVGLSGNVVVANRAYYYGVQAPQRASAVMIAGDKKDCVDRNGNGQIDTFEGEGEVPPQFFWRADQAQSPDECVIWLTHLTRDRNGNIIGAEGTLPRAAAYDAVIDEATGQLREYVYIGLYNTREVVQLDARNGTILRQFPVDVNPYGAVMDRFGNLWVRGNGLARVEVRKPFNEATKTYPYTVFSESPAGCSYGITADARGYIYTAGNGGLSSCVSRFNPATMQWEHLMLYGPSGNTACFPRGLALDSKYNLWVADTCAGIFHIDARNDFGGGMIFRQRVSPNGVAEARYYLGVGIDANDNPWLVSENRGGAFLLQPPDPGTSSMVYRIEPGTYQVRSVVTGRNSYTYSDMTGAQLRIAGSPTGIYRQLARSECGSRTTRWQTLSWQVDTPEGTEVRIRLRGASTLVGLDAAPFTDVTRLPGGAAPPYAINLPPGTAFLQVELHLKSDSIERTPAIRSLHLRYLCE
ncbi:MAG: hypothetical protein RMK29_20290 [Myxococcales bacterium]|nr:hypothetical protein [Myxococcota bacterium]MDW8284050.1 hypothetical protein [Myxococcales bacterium]